MIITLWRLFFRRRRWPWFTPIAVLVLVAVDAGSLYFPSVRPAAFPPYATIYADIARRCFPGEAIDLLKLAADSHLRDRYRDPVDALALIDVDYDNLPPDGGSRFADGDGVSMSFANTGTAWRFVSTAAADDDESDDDDDDDIPQTATVAATVTSATAATVDIPALHTSSRTFTRAAPATPASFPPYAPMYAEIARRIFGHRHHCRPDIDLFKLAADSQIDYINTAYTGVLAVVDVDYSGASPRGATGNGVCEVFADNGTAWIFVGELWGEGFDCHDDDRAHVTRISSYYKCGMDGGTDKELTVAHGAVISISETPVTIGAEVGDTSATAAVTSDQTATTTSVATPTAIHDGP